MVAVKVQGVPDNTAGSRGQASVLLAHLGATWETTVWAWPGRVQDHWGPELWPGP